VSKKLTALGVDIFAGLFTVGVKREGFEILGHLEHGSYGVPTARLNFPRLDIRERREDWEEARYKGKVDLVYSNPPCAAWSAMKGKKMDNWASEDEVHRMNYIRDVVSLASSIKPKAWCWESVTRAWAHGRPFVMAQAEALCRAGMHATVFLYDNQYLGAPQRRPRMMLIGHRHPLVWGRFSESETVGEVLRRASKLKEPPGAPTMELTPVWKHLWKISDKYGGSLRQALLALDEAQQKKLNTRPLGIVRRLNEDRVAPVMIQGLFRLHPREPRPLTYGEWLEFCGLPRTFKTACTRYDPATRELARAVMPPVGRWVAETIKRGLAKPALRTKPCVRLFDASKPDRPINELLWTLGDKPTPQVPVIPVSVRVPRQPERVFDRPAKAPRTGSPRVPKRGCGFFIRTKLAAGWDATRILAAVRQEFPASKATESDVSWNKAKLARQGGAP
jgi:site-specific DNA-cytosine methylase